MSAPSQPLACAAALDPLSAKIDSVHKRLDEQAYNIKRIGEKVDEMVSHSMKVSEHVFGNGGASLRYLIERQGEEIKEIKTAREADKKERDSEEKTRSRGKIAIVGAVLASITSVIVASISTCGGGL